MKECLLDHLMSIVEYLISYNRIPVTGVYHMLCHYDDIPSNACIIV